MSQHDESVRLRHMLDYAHTARRLISQRARLDLDHDEALRLTLTRAIEVIGEAAGKVSLAYQQQHPDIPWRNIISTRHRLIHGYDRVDLDQLWHIVQKDLPLLITQLETLLVGKDNRAL